MKTPGLLSMLLLGLTFLACDEDDEPTIAPRIDLAAHSITFSVDPTTEFEGTATITGTVKNLGDDFVSGEGQQTIMLYERPLGLSSGQEVARREFTDLSAGDSLTVSFERDWNRSSPAEGEFPPDYVLVISYDPDLLIDDNPANDDSNSSNNSIEENGAAINEMF